MNPKPYATPKHFFRTSYSPSSQIVRPSSLTNPVFSQNHIASSPMIRIENTVNSSFVRQMPNQPLDASRASLHESTKKISNNDYYPENVGPDAIRALNQKMDELSKRVNRNT